MSDADDTQPLPELIHPGDTVWVTIHDRKKNEEYEVWGWVSAVHAEKIELLIVGGGGFDMINVRPSLVRKRGQ